jgi:hydrogenase nickel incorporation protein HypA/HybF
MTSWFEPTMHEASLAIEVVRILEAQSDRLRSITRVELEVGALACVDAPTLRAAVLAAVRGTIADSAVVDIVATLARASCLTCGHEEAPPDRLTPCSACGSPRRRWLSGGALKVRSVEGVTR